MKRVIDEKTLKALYPPMETAFEVQMRLYERDVNDTLMIDADRKEEEEDVDS